MKMLAEVTDEQRGHWIRYLQTFCPYRKYKESGCSGWARFPGQWDVWKVAHAFENLGSGTTPKSDNLEYYDGETPWVTTSELRETVICDTKAKVTNAALRDHPSLRLYPPGSLLFAMYGATIGRLDSRRSCYGQPSLLRVQSAANARSEIHILLVLMRRPVLVGLSSGGGQPNLSQDDLRDVRIPAPGLGSSEPSPPFSTGRRPGSTRWWRRSGGC